MMSCKSRKRRSLKGDFQLQIKSRISCVRLNDWLTVSKVDDIKSFRICPHYLKRMSKRATAPTRWRTERKRESACPLGSDLGWKASPNFCWRNWKCWIWASMGAKCSKFSLCWWHTSLKPPVLETPDLGNYTQQILVNFSNMQSLSVFHLAIW